MRQRDARALIALIILALSALAAYIGTTPETTVPQDTVGDTYPIVHVADGDTLDVLKDGAKVRVRLIGINAPESVDPKRPAQCFGKEASSELKRVALGTEVSLETDPSQDTYDKYGRLLAYVFASTTNLNLHMIEAGYAYEYTYDLPYKYQREFRAAQHDAQTAGRGLWAAGMCEN